MQSTYSWAADGTENPQHRHGTSGIELPREAGCSKERRVSVFKEEDSLKRLAQEKGKERNREARRKVTRVRQ